MELELELELEPTSPRKNRTIRTITNDGVTIRLTKQIMYDNNAYFVVTTRRYQTAAYNIFRKMRDIHKIFPGVTGNAYNYAPNGDITIIFPNIISELLILSNPYSLLREPLYLLHPDLLSLMTTYIESLPKNTSYMDYHLTITEDMDIIDYVNMFDTLDGLALIIHESGKHIPIWNNDNIHMLCKYMNHISKYSLVSV